MVDLVWLDGGHFPDTISSDFSNCLKVSDKNTIIVLDDYYTEREDVGCKKLIDNLDRELFNVKILEPPDILPDKTIHLVRVRLND